MTTTRAEKFLRELGRDIPENERVMVGYADEATVQTDEHGKKLNAGWWPEPWKDGKHIRDRDNCYACISSSIKTPNPKTGAQRYWRGEASFGHGLALMVDDIGDGKGSKGGLTVEALSSVLPPTVIVATSPGNHQLWYFLDTPEQNMGLFKRFLLAFVGKVLVDKGGDSTIRDVSRYGRMPCGINNKRGADKAFKYGGKNGCAVSVVGEPDYSVRYSIDAIAKAFKFEIPEAPAPREVHDDPSTIRDERQFNRQWLDIAAKALSKAKQGEGSNGDVVMNMSGKFRIACPWGDEHTNSDPYGAYFRGGIPGAEYEFVFGCAHDTCRKDNKRTWATFVDAIPLNLIVNGLRRANEAGLTMELNDMTDIC